MSIQLAEKLKKEWTDKFVVVSEGTPELRRFVGLTGKVKTVNMNGRALVEFDGPEDISWYDIDPSYLKTVDAPAPKKKAAAPPAKEKPKPAAEAKPSAKKKGGGLSPLELARQQGAAGAAPSKAAPAKPAEGEKKAKSGLSPLELARQQGAAGKKDDGDDKSSADQQSETSSPSPPSQPEGKKLSPLELARMQDSKKDE